MGGSPSKQPKEGRKWEEEKKQQKRDEAVDRLRQAIYGGNARLPANVQTISKQRKEERKRKEQKRQHERDEAANRLRHDIYGVYTAEIELLSKQQDEEIDRNEEKRQQERNKTTTDRSIQAICTENNRLPAETSLSTQREEEIEREMKKRQQKPNEAVERLGQGEYPELPAEIQRLIEQKKLEERLQHELISVFQNCIKLKVEKQQAKSAENVFLKHKVTKNLDLLNDFRKAFGLTILNRYPDKPYTETDLLVSCYDYSRASTAFRIKSGRFFAISKITRVDNTFHVLQYKLMQDKYRDSYNARFLEERLMFHGTKREFLDSICTYNFDRSKVVNHKFGHGISFATDSFYATHYPRDNKRNCHKVMVIAQVFFRVGVERSTANMIVPTGSYYTSSNADGNVLVKYDDASFYPLYIVYYEGLHPRNMYRCRH